MPGSTIWKLFQAGNGKGDREKGETDILDYKKTKLFKIELYIFLLYIQ